MNVLDNVIAFFNPTAGLKRLQRRAAINTLKRGFEAARRDKRTKGWKTDHVETNPSLSDLHLMKQRSRDLFNNNPYANNAHTTIAHSVTGTGIIPAIVNEKLKKIWKDWADDIACDYDEQLNFYGIQNLVMQTMSVHGECLVLRIKTDNKERVPLELKVISTRYLDKMKDTDKAKSGGYINGAIEYDANGKRKGYWIYKQDPTLSYDLESIFWKKEDVIHLFKVDEPGQNRGVPFGVSSIGRLRDFDDYEDAQLIRQKIAACFSVFVTDTGNEGFGQDHTDEYSEGRLEKLEPGIIEHLEPGKSVTFASPPAADGFDKYSRNVLTGISSGFGITYESMTGDLSNVNFSSGRMGWLSANMKTEAFQWFIMVPKLCDGVWKWFVDAAVIAGKISKNTPVKIEWTPPRRQMIDPVKETKGLLEQVRAGFISWQEAVRSLGYTPDEILEEMKKSATLFEAAKLRPTSDPRFDKGVIPEPEAKNEEDDTDKD